MQHRYIRFRNESMNRLYTSVCTAFFTGLWNIKHVYIIIILAIFLVNIFFLRFSDTYHCFFSYYFHLYPISSYSRDTDVWEIKSCFHEQKKMYVIFLPFFSQFFFLFSIMFLPAFKKISNSHATSLCIDLYNLLHMIFVFLWLIYPGDLYVYPFSSKCHSSILHIWIWFLLNS